MRRDDATGADSHKALARRHQRRVRRYAPLMAALLVAGSFALFIFAETYFGPTPYRPRDRRHHDDGVSALVAHAVMGAFRATGASDSAICAISGVMALGSFLALGGIGVMLWFTRPVRRDKSNGP